MSDLEWFILVVVLLIGYIFCHNVWEKLQDIENNTIRLLNMVEDLHEQVYEPEDDFIPLSLEGAQKADDEHRKRDARRHRSFLRSLRQRLTGGQGE